MIKSSLGYFNNKILTLPSDEGNLLSLPDGEIKHQDRGWWPTKEDVIRIKYQKGTSFKT